MLTRSTIIPVAILVAALVGPACDSPAQSPAAPTQSPDATTPAPTVSSTPPPPELVGVWQVMVRLTDVTTLENGAACIAETMRSQADTPIQYSLSITDTGRVTIANASGDYSCSFSPVMDGSGFTTYGKGGYYDCTGEPQVFRCGDGATHTLISFGQDISGRVSGAEITGTWEIFWYSRADPVSGVDVKTQFTGTR